MGKKTKICMFFNTAARYRQAIYSDIDKEYECDWFFNREESSIKRMDLSLLKNIHFYNCYGDSKRLFWRGKLITNLFKKKYKNFFVLSEVRNLSLWFFTILKILLYPDKTLYGWSHGWYGRESKFQKRLDRWRINRMDGLFLYNKRARDIMIEGGINPEKLFVIGNSLDYDKQLKIRKKIDGSDIYLRHFNNNYKTLIFIGRLIKPKRIDILLQALYLLKERGEKYNVVLVGDGEIKTSLEELSKSLGLNVWFYGACYDETINAELIYNADLCISPGNVGLTAIHSLMFGTPVITSDDFTHQGPEAEAIKDGITGCFFSNGNSSSLADAISRWVKNNINRSTIRQLCYNEIERQWTPYYQMKVIKENLKLKE